MDFNFTYSPDRAKKLEKKRQLMLLKKAAEGKDTTSLAKPFVRKNKFKNSFTVSLFNVYNRYNPYFIYVTRTGDFTRGDLKVGAKQVSLFPLLPSITWNFKF